MSILLDTNVLARLAQHTHPAHPTAQGAVAALQRRGETLVIVPQNLYELWVVATRPGAANGLGFDAAGAGAELERVRSLFAVLDDTPAVLATWQQLVTRHAVLGKNAHDERLVAAMLVHGVSGLLTFNGADFSRYAGISILDPAAVALPPSP